MAHSRERTSLVWCMDFLISRTAHSLYLLIICKDKNDIRPFVIFARYDFCLLPYFYLEYSSFFVEEATIFSFARKIKHFEVLYNFRFKLAVFRRESGKKISQKLYKISSFV